MQIEAGGAARIWDVPIRIVHWSFVLLMPALWWTAEQGDLTRHRQLGYVMLGLVIFRILWGLFGSSTARFASFVKGPVAVINYLRTLFSKSDSEAPGHNPLGAISVIALLGLLVTQASIGLFAQDVDGIESGPLAYLVSYDGADAAREWHHSLFNGLLILIAIHILAILFYQFFKRDNLIGPMVTGKKRYAAPVAELVLAPVWRATVAAAFSAGLVWWIAQGAPLPLSS
jgi:cytochrome b